MELLLDRNSENSWFGLDTLVARIWSTDSPTHVHMAAGISPDTSTGTTTPNWPYASSEAVTPPHYTDYNANSSSTPKDHSVMTPPGSPTYESNWIDGRSPEATNVGLRLTRFHGDVVESSAKLMASHMIRAVHIVDGVDIRRESNHHQQNDRRMVPTSYEHAVDKNLLNFERRKSADSTSYYGSTEKKSSFDNGHLSNALEKRLKEMQNMAQEKLLRERRRARWRKSEMMEALELYSVLLGLLYLGVADTQFLSCSDITGPLVLTIASTVFTAVFTQWKLAEALKYEAAATGLRSIRTELEVASERLRKSTQNSDGSSDYSTSAAVKAIEDARSRLELVDHDGNATKIYYTPSVRWYLVIVAFPVFFLILILVSFRYILCPN